VVRGLVSDSLLILAPLLVLAVVLLLGFAGCGFESIAPGTLTFRARVPTELKVVSLDGVAPPGVKFTWTRPDGTVEWDTATSLAPGPSVAAYVDAVLELAPSLFWTLGNVNGLDDRSGNGRNGTAVGGVTVGGQPDGPTDFHDATATHFDGVDDLITSAYNPFVGTGGRTFVGFTRRDTSATNDLLFGSGAAATVDQARLFLPANENVRFEPNGSDGQVIAWTNAWPGNARWVWWALRFDQGADKVSLFIDGQLVSVQDCTEAWPAAPGNFQVGAAGTTTAPLGGDSGLIAVYETLLPNTRLAELYQASQVGGDTVYELAVSSQAGSWFGRCEMRVRADSQTAYGGTLPLGFDVESAIDSYELLFQAEGSPLGPPFGIKIVGLSEVGP
jgi:hypothetical protein